MAELPSGSSKSTQKAPKNSPAEVKPFAPGILGHPALKLSNTIEKLKAPGPESNYLEWSWVLDMHFETTGVIYIINPSYPNPEQVATYAHDNATPLYAV